VAHALTWDWRIRTATNSLVRAFVVSIAVHLLLFGFVETGYRYDLWRFSPLNLLANWLKPPLKPEALKPAAAQARPRPPERQVQEIPVVFVDVDPSQASDEVPPETPYYSAVTSRAGNPDPDREAGKARMDGKQNLVLKTLDSDRAKPSVVPPPAPVVAKPLEPGEDRKPERPRNIAEIGPPPEEAPKPVTEARAELKPGDLAMAKPGPEQKPAPRLAAPNMPEAPTTNARPRPRTVAAARAQMDHNPQSALVGQKMFQDGGVQRFSVQPSIDTKGSPLGGYDARFIAAVQECWYALLEQQRYSLDRLGKVTVEFRLTAEGRITDMKVADSDVGEIYTTLCQLAITKPSPYEKWPTDVRRLVGNDYRDIRFTFYY
jgi:hypothetical protein